MGWPCSSADPVSLLLPPWPLVLLLVLMCSAPVASLPTSDSTLNDHNLFSKLQSCFSESGMAELDNTREPLIQNMPDVSQRRDILQTFLDCCSKLELVGKDGRESGKQKPSVSELAFQLKSLQQKIHTIYKKFLMGSSVGLSVHG